MADKGDESSVDIEGLLKREVGYFGRYQICIYTILSVISIPAALSTNEYIFTAANIGTRCFIPECEYASSDQAVFAPVWIMNAVPPHGSGVGFDNCQRFDIQNVTESMDDSCPAVWFNQNTKIGCDSYVYENENTAVYELGLACDEWRRSFIGTARTVGTLFSLPLIGAISDRWGRRTALTIAGFNTAWIGVLRYFVGTYTGIIVSAFAEAVFGTGALLACGYILFLEMAPAEHRVAIGTISNSFFAIGQMILGLLAWAVPYWRHLTLVLYAPQLLTIAYIWILPESIRWYLCKGLYTKAASALHNIARINGKQLSEQTLHDLKRLENMNKKDEKEIQKTKEKEPRLIVLVFKHKPILLRCAVGPVWWITMTLVYYGLSINAVNIAGNPYVNYIVVAAIEIPGFWTAMLLVQRIGRKPVLLVSYWICAAGQIGYIFIPRDNYAVSLSVYLLSKYGISSVVTSLYLYTTEIYPTPYRQSLFSFSSMMGRVGLIIAPLTPALGAMVWAQLPFALFATMAFLSGLLVFVMPETRGFPLPNTMQEAADIGRPVHKRTHTVTPKHDDSFSRL